MPVLTRLEPLRIPVNRRGDWLLLRVHTDDGRVGLGDGSHSHNDAEVWQAWEEALPPLLLGRKVLDLDARMEALCGWARGRGDTRAAVTECYSIVFREELGMGFPPADFPIGELFAMRPPEVFAIAAPDRVEALHAAYRAAYPRCTALVKVFDGVRELILGLRDSGRKPSIVTNKGLERTLIDLGRDIAAHPIEILPGVRETLHQVAERYRIILITKGDLMDQEQKLARSVG